MSRTSIYFSKPTGRKFAAYFLGWNYINILTPLFNFHFSIAPF